MYSNFYMISIQSSFADTFDDVISTVVATGALDSGTAGSALRGGVVA